MSDLIDRQAAIDALGDMPMSWADTDAEIQAQEDWKQHREALMKLPTAEKKGKWIVHKSPDEYHCGLVECPFCGEELIAEPNEYCFCPNCGARMEEENNETDNT